MKAMGKHVLFAAVLVLGGCGTKQDTAVQPASTADDPAAANLASVSDAQQVTQPPPQQTAPQQAAAPQPAYSQPLPQEAPPVQQDSYGSESVEYAPDPPPPLPEYTQPECPGENYIWTPGAWDYASTGYYWVPGVWVMAPFVGALWTPSYWDYESTRYRWHRGYWGPHIGFYGGVNYGYGYVGRGYEGGYWHQNVFAYNRAVTNVNVTIVHNVYNHSVSVSGFGNRVSYNGGRGGINARPIPAELAVSRERPIPPVAAQVEHMRQAAGNREQFASVNHGRPQVAVAPRPLTTNYREPARERPVQQEARPVAPAHVEQPRAQQMHPQQARPEPARPETRPAQPAARMPQNEMRPVAPRRAEPRQEARPAQAPTRQEAPRQEAPRREPPTQEARPVQQQPRPETRPVQPQPRQEGRPVQQQPRPETRQVQPQPRQEARPVQQQPRPETRPAQPQHERPAPAAAPRQENHPPPAARPAEQHPAEPHPGKPEEKKKP